MQERQQYLGCCFGSTTLSKERCCWEVSISSTSARRASAKASGSFPRTPSCSMIPSYIISSMVAWTPPLKRCVIVYLYIHTYIHTYKHMYSNLVSTHSNSHICSFINTSLYIFHIQACICTSLQHTYIHIHTYIHTHIRGLRLGNHSCSFENGMHYIWVRLKTPLEPLRF